MSRDFRVKVGYFLYLMTVVWIFFGFSFSKANKIAQLIESNRPNEAIRKIEIAHGIKAKFLAIFFKGRINFQDSLGRTPLILAAERGNLEVVQALVQAKAQLNKKDHRGHTALSLALSRGFLEVAYQLILAGANPPETPEEIQLLGQPNLELGSPLALNLMRISINKKFLPMVHFLIQAGLDLRMADEKGETPLMWAVERGDADLVQEFLVAGANVNQKATWDRTALSIATSFERGKIAVLLFQAGADLSSITHSLGASWFVQQINKYETELGLFFTRRHIEAVKAFTKAYRLSLPDGLAAKFLKKLNAFKLEELESWLEAQKARGLTEAPLPPSEFLSRCVICHEQGQNSKPASGPSNCDCVIHPECIQEFLSFELMENGPNLSRCPGCKGELKADFLIRSGIGDTKATLFRINSLRKKLSERPGWHYCANPECLNGKDFAPGESPYFRCDLCDRNACLLCRQDHRGDCSTYAKSLEMLQDLLKKGALPPPKGGYPSDSNDPNYLIGRYRPCYYCGVITEKETPPKKSDKDEGRCNQMICRIPKCKKIWHWIYGDFNLHPHIQEEWLKEVVPDWEDGPRMYEPLQPAWL